MAGDLATGPARPELLLLAALRGRRALALALALAGEVLGRALLTLGADLAVADQLAQRQRQVAGGGAQLLVDLLDAQARVLGDEVEDHLAGLRQLGLRTLRALGPATAAAAPEAEQRQADAGQGGASPTSRRAAGRAQRRGERVHRRLPRHRRHLRHELVDKLVDLR